MRCFFIEPHNRARRYLRRYSGLQAARCPLPHGYHDTMTFIDEVDAEQDERGIWESVTDDLVVAHDDPRWPTQCACGYAFTEKDAFQPFAEYLWICRENGLVTPLHSAPPGAMWYADWMLEAGNAYRGPDGHCLIVKCPDGHDWMVDGRASNCTMPNDNEHKCWVRHGEVPNITVDKAGYTCGAGGGSILTPKYHGFLRNGEFTSC